MPDTPDIEYHEHVAGDKHAHPFNGPHSHGGVSGIVGTAAGPNATVSFGGSPTMPDAPTLDFIRADIAKYPTPYDGKRAPGEHDPVVYCRALLAYIDELAAERDALAEDEHAASPTAAQEERFKWAANQRADDLAEAGRFMLGLVDAIYGTDNEGMDLPDEAEYRRFRKIIEEPHDA